MLEIYKNKKVFITGHTGFKGSWLMALLNKLGAHVAGFALAPNTVPDHFSLVNAACESTIADLNDKEKLQAAMSNFEAEVVFHLAAQPLVRASYEDPLNTYQTNVIGTLNVLEAVRNCSSVKAVVLITTDKVYDNKEHERPYIETDELGGYDMYSSSKACCEILIRSYRNSFFNIADYKSKHHVLLASARAGNVIGGGDWSKDRLMPDIVKATAQSKKVVIRNPLAVRPWQHVLDCLTGYLLLGEKLLKEEQAFAEAWNFAPCAIESRTVQEVAAIARIIWPKINIVFGVPPNNFHEAGLLKLDNTKAVTELGWKPVWNTEKAIEKTIEWYRSYYESNELLTINNINEYIAACN